MVKNEGHIEYDDLTPPTNIQIKIDANTAPLNHMSAVIHELLHVVSDSLHAGRLADDLKEVLVLSLERHMYEYVKSSKTRLAKWNSLIERKLAENQEKLADRRADEQK